MSETVKYFYKGNDTDLIIYVKSEDAVKKYLAAPAISKLADTVEVFQIFANSDGKGVEGQLGEASHAQLENEFGKGKKTEDILDLILRNGQSKSARKTI
ncbi:hypothetical protein Kpol_1055p14 [Vanderwaltozyma polyspora DSM 70294]|uniref:Ribosome maturation protein SDO1/SBDS N-terminal domain-containing protein n=1 Tax=Vanderwaltozyma polyspora (strain ATCC 22028 / DSM 70294 / BCRC 21397 / CBS 2163 / NBRC 10782 / NRRL Y-8283 / UCD 57-17) TaxID=436907 RepID=A7TG88_VANPO|nr:uncharacterized protein Kpol_1055p14 [Vanderwaltozyma polyspora DSM 70294]EDO18658.1 hypothetical protein Kpol_1055p14 [Vanderwaltozyma polyspora DSM 70294]